MDSFSECYGYTTVLSKGLSLPPILYTTSLGKKKKKKERKSFPGHIEASNWGIWEKYLARFFSFSLFKLFLYFTSVWY